MPPPMWMRCARGTSRHGPHHGGAAILDNALNIFNNNGALCRLRARIHVEAKEFEPARKLLEKALWIERTDYPTAPTDSSPEVLGDKQELDRKQHGIKSRKIWKSVEEKPKPVPDLGASRLRWPSFAED